jgi:hypothetical protein
MRTSVLALVVATAAALAGPADAAEPARSMAALDARVKPGTQVDIVDREGRMWRGEFVRADDQGILLAGYGGDAGKLVGAAEVANVVRAGDSLKNGMLIGAGVGVVTAIAMVADDGYNEYDGYASECESTGCRAAVGIALVPVYAGIGALIDKAFKGRETVYRAPSDRVSWQVTPHPVRGGAGVRVAVSF